MRWFNSHPESASARSAFKLFNEQDCALESNFFWFSESATKQKIAAATDYSQNWEDSELTRKPQYKVGIDFFLTPEANSLLVVLSNHQKLRVLELQGSLSNTQKLFSRINLMVLLLIQELKMVFNLSSNHKEQSILLCGMLYSLKRLTRNFTAILQAILKSLSMLCKQLAKRQMIPNNFLHACLEGCYLFGF